MKCSAMTERHGRGWMHLYRLEEGHAQARHCNCRTTWGDSEGEGEIVSPGGSQAPSTPIDGRVP